MINLTEAEKRVLQALVEGLPLVPHPFAEIAQKIGLPEEDIINITRSLLEKKIIRRLGATLRHNLAGYQGNAMVAWQVPEDRVEAVGKILAEKKFVSHCYIRETYPEWPYNLYTMCHARTKDELDLLLKETAAELNLKEYQILYTKREIVRKHARYYL